MVNKRYRVLIGLDRDGTLIHDPGYLGRDHNWKSQIRILPGTTKGLKALRTIPGARIVVCSNQAGVARGYFTTGTVEESNDCIDDLLRAQGVRVDKWYYCPFVSWEYAKEKKINLSYIWVQDTDIRKPGIGMLRKAAVDVDMRLEDFDLVCFIGDKFDDVMTGINAGGSGIFLDNGDNEHVASGLEKTKSAMSDPKYEGRIFIAKDLSDAAEQIKIIQKLQGFCSRVE